MGYCSSFVDFTPMDIFMFIFNEVSEVSKARGYRRLFQYFQVSRVLLDKNHGLRQKACHDQEDGSFKKRFGFKYSQEMCSTVLMDSLFSHCTLLPYYRFKNSKYTEITEFVMRTLSFTRRSCECIATKQKT